MYGQVNPMEILPFHIQTMKFVFAVGLIVLPALILLLHSSRSHLASLFSLKPSISAMEQVHLTGDSDDDTPCLPPRPMIRTTFGDQTTVIQGWPSTGGIFQISDADAVVLDFLQLDRFKETPRSDNPEEEDAFCRRLCMIGARWWSSEEESEKPLPSKVRDGRRVTMEKLWLGWTETGGVWVLSLDDYEGTERGVGRIKNAINMEERCRAIEMLGGVFHSNGEAYLRDN